MNTTRVFRVDWKFYRLGQRFRATLNPVMIRAREEYKKEWRKTCYYDPPKTVPTFFRDDYRSMKDLIWNQTVYLKWSWVLYRWDSNTAEMRFVYPLYWFNDDRKINAIWTGTKSHVSSAMFKLEPVDKFPREEWWTIIPGEKYKDVGLKCWRDADIFVALGWVEARDEMDNQSIFRMYWTWEPYWYSEWYKYVDGNVLNRQELETPAPTQTPEEHLVDVMNGINDSTSAIVE